ncbi:hypothetical protein, partial [Duncaniella freteri]|uniref:hypothetical protein n=1 Tax=Duncaniella freteri TaxID=2530391 RepID=UPI0032B28E6B
QSPKTTKSKYLNIRYLDLFLSDPPGTRILISYTLIINHLVCGVLPLFPICTPTDFNVLRHILHGNMQS